MLFRLLFAIYFCLTIVSCAIANNNTATTPLTTRSTIPSMTQPHSSFWHQFTSWFTSFFHRKEKCKEWDLLIFAQAFPVPFCALKHDNWCQTYLNESEWIVRGIWPTRKNGKRVTECSNIEFNATALHDILPAMKQHWTSILHKDEDFWSRQWVKHGSCSLDLFKTQALYFSQGLKWNEEWPLGQILRKKNIFPSNDRVYTYNNFYDNIREVLGHTPHLKCHSYKNISFIKEVRLCVSKKMKLVNCHKNYKQKSDCPQDGIIYPRTPDFYKKLYVFSSKLGQQLANVANTTVDIVKGLDE